VSDIELGRFSDPVRPLRDVTARDGAIAGGKGANLGELLRAGLAVPEGFIVTTEAYRRVASELDAEDAARARARLAGTTIPDDVAAAVRAAYRALGAGLVAVRSSATAEDLPEASFAGQQDTFLGVEGEDDLLDAIRRCWASLWNERAIAYRRSHDIEGHGLALAVVVQRMVDARAAGVLFTADPVTGRRRRAVIDAVAGLGDRLVSGAANPEHFVVDPASGEVLERRGAVLDDTSLRELAAAGARIETHYGRPQDIEWAIDRAGALWIVQSRDITTLYPLPSDLPDPEIDLRVLFSANVAQGLFQPFTPMGLQTFRLIGSAFAGIVGKPPADPEAGVPTTKTSGLRLWIDITPLVRDGAARHLAERVLSVMEARSGSVLTRLLADPRLAPRASGPRTRLRVAQAVVRTGIPLAVVRTLLRPEARRQRVLREVDAIVDVDLGPAQTSLERVTAFERLFLVLPPRMFPRLVGLAAAGFASYNLAGRVLGRAVQRDELRTVLRGLAFNPTTEMDLALWDLARRTRDDPTAEERELTSFLARYGHRAVAEIDLGVPRWAEDPSHLRAAMATYRRITDPAQAPDAVFARGAREAEAMIATLLARVHGPRRWLARVLLRRVRALGGLREMPKFQIIRVFARGRALLAPIGHELAASGRLARADDLWFLSLPEVRRAIAGEDMRDLVATRRAEYGREMKRRHIPRLLLSDGTDAEAALAEPSADGIRGTPASPGVARGSARVLLSPDGARLEPGEVLVAPATDPGWTPLFLAASALVMEMGGMMSHGAVVAREYGIPAVVGVPGATERIATGDQLVVDGSAGTVSLKTP
jgi:phosphohistidine swiveling domain-containing protein